MATARGEHEALHRPYLQKQSQKRTHRQPQRGIGLQRRQRPLQVALIESKRNESFLAGCGPLRESEARLRHLSHSQDSVHDRRRIRDAAATESDAPDAVRTLETPYTGSSSRPLQSPFGPYP